MLLRKHRMRSDEDLKRSKAMKVNFELLYEHIGYLFYSLSKDDGQFSVSDLKKLKELVDLRWRHDLNGDGTLQTHLTDCIHLGIRVCVNESWTSEKAFLSFKNFYKIHSLPFSSSLREKILS